MSDIYKKRRDTLLDNITEGVVVICSAPYKSRSNDTEYPYRQDSNFYYLCGFKEDNSILVMTKSDKRVKTYLFVEPKDEKLELWNGKRLGVIEAKKAFEVDKIFSIKKFKDKMSKILVNHKRLYFDLFNSENEYCKILQSTAVDLTKNSSVKVSPREFIDVIPAIQKQRLIKSHEEIALILQAIDITAQAHHSAMMIKKDKLFEYQIQAQIEHVFKTNGAYSDAYTTIVAGGNSANTLHYISNNNKLKIGDLILIDAGCEYEMYASDITRTIPVSGRFTKSQKELYNMVLGVQLKVIEKIAPGITKKVLQELSEELLTRGLVELGILKGDVKYLIKNKKHKKYFPHGIGHWMGIDVHDPCPYYDENGDEIKFNEGMVLTIEPGVYIDEADKNVPEKYRGIGIRIEDNILVTHNGYENLSISIAKSVEEIEAIYN